MCRCQGLASLASCSGTVYRRRSTCHSPLGNNLHASRLPCVLVHSLTSCPLLVTITGSTYEEILDKLAHEALQAALQLPDNQQYIIGIAGCPGSGKSTLAREVARRITQKCRDEGLARTAVVAPMDGFHYYKKQLDRMPDPQVRQL